MQFAQYLVAKHLKRRFKSEQIMQLLYWTWTKYVGIYEQYYK